ncbi:MAG: hypothetical protein CL897_04480 [Dehalococcoidia bacterium]|nr:hypothetical protein [Dehalococcoidia bacterium]|tara:strand:- start:225 stop:1022 length:798 start_codon:yes stop_codon:yes gene_type:complete
MSGLGIGERLIGAREERGLTLEDAERDTRISRRYLQALEDERFDIIPAPVYARGFLRSYSQYLGLETAGLLARFPQDSPPVVSPSSNFERQEGRSSRGPSTLFGSRVPDDPMIGVDIGVTIAARRRRTVPLPFARAGVIASVAIAVTAIAIVLAVAIADSGNGNDSLEDGVVGSAASNPVATQSSQDKAVPTSSGLEVEYGVVPDVVGHPEDIARLAVQEAGFEVAVVTDRNEQYPRGTVFEQAPSAGVEQDPGRGVFIAVSQGP